MMNESIYKTSKLAKTLTNCLSALGGKWEGFQALHRPQIACFLAFKHALRYKGWNLVIQAMLAFFNNEGD